MTKVIEIEQDPCWAVQDGIQRQVDHEEQKTWAKLLVLPFEPEALKPIDEKKAYQKLLSKILP